MRPRRKGDERGQSLVEFALIFPIFILLFIGLIEFSVTLSVMLNVNYASRDSALLSAEVGDAAGADCLILQRLDRALGGGAAHHSGIQEVRIFWADANGVEIAANAYNEGGLGTTCTLADGSTATVPYIAGAGWPELPQHRSLHGPRGLRRGLGRPLASGPGYGRRHRSSSTTTG